MFVSRFLSCRMALLLALMCGAFSLSTLAQETNVRTAPASSRAYFYEPAISPDHTEIAFVSGGDIWTVAATGGEARLLVSHPATEFRPAYSPDGKRIAFTSARTGNGDIYVLTLESGDLKRLTFDDGFEQMESWSRDGNWIYFSTTAHDISGSNDIFRIRVDGGTPMPVSADRYANEFMSAPSPDGKSLAFVGRGFSQWWRHGRAHIDESAIWLMRDFSTANYERLTEGGVKELWPMWSADARSIFYVSDRNGTENVWTQAIGGRSRQLTEFKDGRVLWPSISNDGRMIVFERDFGIWKLDTSNNRAEEVKIARRGAAAAPAIERVKLTDQCQEMSLAPDGKKVAFVTRGEVFAASATDGGDAVRLTNTPAPESQVAWSPDSRRIVYVSKRNGAAQLYLYDFGTNAETQLTSGEHNDYTPRFSPDGKLLAFERDRRELRVLELDAKANGANGSEPYRERTVATGSMERPPINSDRPFTWSPDSRWIAYMPFGTKSFRNVAVARVDGSGTPQPVSFLANTGNNTVSWSPDGTYILFDTGQRTESSQLARVDLLPRTPRFREDQFRELFKEESPGTIAPTLKRQENQPQSPVPPRESPTTTPSQTPSPTATPAPGESPSNVTTQTTATVSSNDERKKTGKPVEIVFDGIRRRLSLLPVGVDVFYQTISPDGKYVLMIAGAVNQTNLYLFPLDELSKEPAIARQITSTPGFKTSAQFTPDGKEIFYLEAGRIQIAPVDPKLSARSLAVTAEMDVDFGREKVQIFQQGWEAIRDHFYDPNYTGADWQAVHTTFAPLIAGAQTPDEMRRLMSLMVGELNASHLGVSAPLGQAQVTTGRLGLSFDREEYERTGKLRVTEVLPLSPAALAREANQSERRSDIKVGDYLLAVDGKQIDARANLDELLNYKINRRVTLTIASSADGAKSREVDLRPINLATEKVLRYRQWVEDKRAYVERVSGGRLGYVHMFDMSAASLSQLYVDLDAENQAREGVVVDVRHNNGGFVNVYAIDVLARRSYLRMTPRGFATSPARTTLGQRVLELPTALVTDQYSLSDAEDFAEGYRALRLGKVVGEPTAGWIIYTTNTSLIDGTAFRLPFIKVEATDGTNMERNPRPVDVTVTRPIGESYTSHDTQLDAAVQELLKGSGARKEP